MRHDLFIIGAALLAGACVHVAEERAEQDLLVGQAASGDVEVTVHEGRAAVRGLGPGELWLWASAPELSIRLRAGAEARRWSIRIENQLSDAVLSAEAAGEALPVTLAAEPFATERVWEVDVPADAEVALRLRPPDSGLLEPWRFAVYADVQEAIDRVQDIYAKMNEHPEIRFALISGDLTRQGGADELERFQREMKTLPFPCFATLGNHELGQSPTLYHEYFGRGNHHWTFRGVHFTLLDSASATIDPLVYGWLTGWLAEGRGALHVITMHIPPHDPAGLRNGAFASRAEASKLLGMFGRENVDLTFYGHLHTYYAFENAGIPAYISGGGGAIPERQDGIGRHFLTVDVSPPERIGPVGLVRVD